MSFKVISRFNGGNGGVSVIFEEEVTEPLGFGSLEETYTKEHGEFLNVQPAVELGIEIIEKALASRNRELPDVIKAQILGLLPKYGRVVLPVVKK